MGNPSRIRLIGVLNSNNRTILDYSFHLGVYSEFPGLSRLGSESEPESEPEGSGQLVRSSDWQTQLEFRMRDPNRTALQIVHRSCLVVRSHGWVTTSATLAWRVHSFNDQLSAKWFSAAIPVPLSRLSLFRAVSQPRLRRSVRRCFSYLWNDHAVADTGRTRYRLGFLRTQRQPCYSIGIVSGGDASYVRRQRLYHLLKRPRSCVTMSSELS